MTVYIASSWKNQHAVEMLTSLLRGKGYKVLSFVENNYGEGAAIQVPIVFEDWIKTEKANQSFWYDTNGAATSDLVIYISPSGKDAAAEVGIAWANKVPILGLHAKGEDFGLMRKLMLSWYYHYQDLLEAVLVAFPVLSNGQAVQECDATKLGSEAEAGSIKK